MIQRSRFRTKVIPVLDIELMDPKSRTWAVTGVDPQFALQKGRLRFPLSAGEYKMTAIGGVGLDALRDACLYIDTGAGYNENQRIDIRFDAEDSGAYTAFCSFEAPVVALRLDPTSGDYAEFSLTGVEFRRVTKESPSFVDRMKSGAVAGPAVGAIVPVAEHALERRDVTKRCGLDQFHNFVLKGWIVERDGKRPDLVLELKGERIECSAVFIDDESGDAEAKKRAGSTAGSGARSEASGQDEPRIVNFEIEISGLVWERVSGEQCDLVIRDDGASFKPLSFSLTRKLAISTIEKIFETAFDTSNPEEPMKEFWDEAQSTVLLALEHMHYGRFWPELEPQTRKRAARLAQKLNVASLVLDKALSEKQFTLAPPPVATMTQWNALRLLNESLAKPRQSVFEAVCGVIEAMQLIDDERRSFVLSALPHLCRADEMAQIRSIIPVQQFNYLVNYLEKASDAWSLSLAVALMMSDGDVRRASEIMYRLAGASGGWLNTPCIHYAVRRCEQLYASNHHMGDEAAKFR